MVEDKKDIKAPREREREEDAGIRIFPELVSQLAAGWSPGAEKKNANYFFTCKHFTVIIRLIGFKEYVCVICSHRPIYP